MSDEKEAALQETETDPETPTGRKKKISEEVKRLSRSEKARNYLVGLGAASALILGLIAQCRGEPVAEKTWTTVRTELNEHTKTINKIRTRLVYFQAWQEAKTAMELQQKLETLQRKYDALKAGKSAAKAPKSMPTKVAKTEKCKDRQVLGDDGKCHWVRKVVATKVQKSEAQVRAMRKALEAEKRKRLALERRKSDLVRKLIQQSKAADAPAPLRALPKRLDDVTKRKK